MIFCECGGMFKKSDGRLVCRSCGKLSKQDLDIKVTQNKKRKGIQVVEDNKPDLPTTKKECPKCENNEAYWWLIQTRSSDEPPTQFYKCTKCKHTWREYK